MMGKQVHAGCVRVEKLLKIAAEDEQGEKGREEIDAGRSAKREQVSRPDPV